MKTLNRLMLLVLALGLLLPAGSASADPWYSPSQFASAHFETQWRRTDDGSVRSGRTWYWGPNAWFDYHEFYRDSPNGTRLVQYFDKARMEINNPNSASVTNGLLVVEMVGGQLKRGDVPWDVTDLPAAEVPVAGDPAGVNASAPTYRSFRSVSTINDPASNRDPERIGQAVSATLDKAGNKGQRADLAQAYRSQTEIVLYNTTTGHNLPRVFVDFFGRRGPIYSGGVRNDVIIDWISAMGLPISDPYWVTTRVGGTQRDVLVQLFERRVLTYTPANSEGFQVEMGNVGQHYFLWRYPHLGVPWAASPAPAPILFTSQRGGGTQWEIYAMEPGGGNQRQFVASGPGDSLPYSVRRAYGEVGKGEIFFDSTRGNSKNRQLYKASLGNGSEITRLSYTDGTTPPSGVPYPSYSPGPGNDYNPSVSPDGSKVAFVSDRSGQHQLYMMYAEGGYQVQLTFENCTHQTPSWSPDGRLLAWHANCDGDWEVYIATLTYHDDLTRCQGYCAPSVELSDVKKLTNNTGVADQHPRISPDGRTIAFQSNRDGNYEIYTMSIDGSNQRRVTINSGDDYAPAWEQYQAALVFSSNRDGDWEIMRINVDGSNQIQLTTNTSNDHWVVWEK